MPVTGWLAPRIGWQRVYMWDGTGVYSQEDWARQVARCHKAAEAGPTLNLLSYAFVSRARTGIPGMTSTWSLGFEWSGILAPVAPANAYSVEWRGRWTVQYTADVLARYYWDQRGVASHPVNGGYVYAIWPWVPWWRDRVWTFGDPRLYRDIGAQEPLTRWHFYMYAADLRARFYY